MICAQCGHNGCRNGPVAVIKTCSCSLNILDVCKRRHLVYGRAKLACIHTSPESKTCSARGEEQSLAARARRDKPRESTRDHRRQTKPLGAAHHVPGVIMEGDEFSLRTSSPRIVSKAPPKTPEKLQLPQLSTSSKGLSNVEIARQLLKEELAQHKQKKPCCSGRISCPKLG